MEFERLGYSVNMSFFSATVTIPVWFLILLNIIMVLLLVKLFSLVHRYRRGEITKEEHSDMVVWTIKNRKPVVTAGKLSVPKNDKKDQEKKDDLVRVLKILLKEGEKGVLLQTIADRMEMSNTKADHALQKLRERKMVDEVVGVSGRKYYLTQTGRDYCRSKAK